nr:TonB-dependent receptor [uncultured Desulfobacter sp.]
MKRFYGFVWGVVFMICCMGISPGFAEDNRGTTLETITVTAQKREGNIQEVPVSISAFSDYSLNDSGIDELEDIVRFSPNVHIKDKSIIIRGVSQFMGAKSSAVGFYMDGVSLPFEGQFSSELFDVERVEVLKGPQGTLYGKNSESGVINIISKQPENEFSSKLSAEYGWYDTEFGSSPAGHIGGYMNVPVVKDKFFLRFSGKLKDDEGYFKNVYNGDDEAGSEENYNGRVNLTWRPADCWDISFIVDAMSQDYSYGHFRYISGELNEGRGQISYDGPYSGEKNGNGQTLRIKYEGDGYDLISITGRRDADDETDFDFDMTSIPAWAMESHFHDDNTNYSQEIRLSSARRNTPFQWITGLYAFDETMTSYQNKIRPSGFSTWDTDVDSFGYAVFGQGTYTFFGKLHLTGGLRYDYTDFEGEQHLKTSSGESVYGKDFDNGEILPKVSVSYDFSDSSMGYVSVARGYLTGGYNCKWATNADNLTYDAEYTWNYEAGMKSSWFDNRLVANLSVFYIDIKDKQVLEWDTTSTTASVKQIRNAANAYSTGLEFDLQARPAQGIDIFAGVGYTKARIDDWLAWEYDKTTGGAYQYDYKDKYLPNVPEFTYNLGVQYRHCSGAFVRADWLGTGSLYSDAKNSAKEEAYQLVNLRLGFESEKYDVYVWCKNLLDEDYFHVRYASAGSDQGIDGEPRMFGVTVNYRF